MDQDTRDKIIEELTAFLNRAPSENEIMNAQTDTLIIGRVKSRQIEEKDVQVKKDINTLQKAVDEVSAKSIIM